MPIVYRRASLSDLDLLADTRVEVLRAANQLGLDADLSDVRERSRAYYAHSLKDGTHTALMVLDGGRVIGTGGVSYYRVMPTFHNPSGEKAYIMNMYTAPSHRRQGIALHTLSLLVEDAYRRGVTCIGLEATDMGRPLYERFGFVPAGSEMLLPEEWSDDRGRP